MNHKIQTQISKILMALLVGAALILLTIGQVVPVSAASKQKTLRVLFTSDLNGKLQPYGISKKDKRAEAGGYARLKTAIDQNKDKSSIVLNAGDYTGDTTFDTIDATDNPSLALMSQMGYDAAMFGGQTFTPGMTAAARSLSVTGLGKTPVLLNANIHFGKSDSAERCRKALQSHGARTQIFIKNGVKVGVFGITQSDVADATAAGHDVSFDKAKTAAKSAVRTLQNKDADVIICLTDTHENAVDGGKTEDEKLAEAVDGIDLIITPNGGEELTDPITVGGTSIVSAGAGGAKLGVLNLSINKDKYQLKNYSLININNKITADKAVNQQVQTIQKAVDTQYFAAYGAASNDVVAKSNKDFSDVTVFRQKVKDNDLANLWTDALRYQAKQTDKQNAIAISNAQEYHNTLWRGSLTVADLYDAIGSGSGTDGTTGASVLSAYLTGDDLRNLCEINAAIGSGLYRTENQFYFAGLRYQYNKDRTPMNRVVKVQVKTGKTWRTVRDDKHYPVVLSTTTADYLKTLRAQSMGVLHISLRNQQGKQVKNNKNIVLKNTNNAEIKSWKCLENYLKAQPQDDSKLSVVPASYNAVRNSRTAVKTHNPGDVVKNTSKLGVITYIIIVVVILLVITVVAFVVYMIKSKRDWGISRHAGKTDKKNRKL